MALPVDEKLFEYIMIRAKKWGLAVYEQVMISKLVHYYFSDQTVLNRSQTHRTG